MSDYTSKSFKDVELVKGEIYTIGWMGSETSLAPYKLLDYSMDEIKDGCKKEYLVLNLQYVDSEYTRTVKLPEGITLFICKGQYDIDFSILASESDRYKASANCWVMYGDFIRYLISQVNEEDVVYASVEFGKINIPNPCDKNYKRLPVLIKNCLRNEWWYNSLIGVLLNVYELDIDNKYYYLIDTPLMIRKQDVVVLK